MALIKKFEDIVAWQEARKLVADIYKLTSSGALAKDYGLRDQLQRAAVSTMTNIAEGFDCESKIEFARFLVLHAAQQSKCSHCFMRQLMLDI